MRRWAALFALSFTLPRPQSLHLYPCPVICTPSSSWDTLSFSLDLRPFLLQQRFSSDTRNTVAGKSMNPLKICTRLSHHVCSFLESRPTAFIRFPKGLHSLPSLGRLKNSPSPRDSFRRQMARPPPSPLLALKKLDYSFQWLELRTRIGGQDEQSCSRNP